ncbi:MAG: trigger factor [Lachnospiraceae bacterium]|nr:trigger factor [Lachnospiraceae bacterium]
MSVQVENLEHNMAKLTVTVDGDRFEKACNDAYMRQRKSISVPGFRKGKVPRALAERMYGENIFFEDGADILLKEVYPEAYDESGLEIVSQPKIDIVQIEKGKEFIFTAEVAVKPEVKLGKYVGVTVTKIDTSVSDDEINEEIDRQRNQNARTVSVERAIEDKDTADINFEGFKDGAPFEGGKGENYKLVIGSHSFIDTFEEQLIGKKAGEDVDINVTFPEKYQEASLAGQPVMFKVHINEVLGKELPEFDADFVQDVSEFETVDDFKNDVKEKLQKTKEEGAKHTKEDEAIAKIIDDSDMDIPEAMITTQEDRMISEMDGNMRQQGLSFQQYLQFTGMTMEQLREQIKPDATKRIQQSLVLEAIAKAEKIEASDEEIEAEIQKVADQYGMKIEDLKKKVTDEEKKSISEDLKYNKAVDFVMENIKERAKAKKKATKKDDESKKDAE